MIPKIDIVMPSRPKTNQPATSMGQGIKARSNQPTLNAVVGYTVLALIFSGLLGCSVPRAEQGSTLETFPLQAIKLLDSPFSKASQVNARYIMQHCPDRLLAPFLVNAGLQPKAQPYGNWESMGLDGHSAGHFLTALALMAASMDSHEALEKLNYMVSELARCQKATGTGYVGGIPRGNQLWDEVARGDIRAGNFTLNGRWVPLYNIDKLFAGLYDTYTLTGNVQALEVLTELGNFFAATLSNLSDNQLQQMLVSEHGGINEAFANLFKVTGNRNFLDLAHRLSHQAILNPLLAQTDQLTGLHANTQIPKVIGFATVAGITGDSAWENASRFFWETVARNRSVAIGGNSTHEHFHPLDDFSSMIETREGPETCNTYNMMILSKLLFKGSGNLRYVDFYERALYNHILGSQHPEHGGLVYFTPMRPNHYRVYSNPEHTFWCCVGTGIENHAKYGELIYAHDGTNLYVNLFIASELVWDQKGLVITQNTSFPDNPETTLMMSLEIPSTFTLFVRHPIWNERAPLEVRVNGRRARGESHPGGYFAITREWRNGDQVQVKFDMEIHGEYFPDNSPYMAILYGPVVLAAATSTDNLDGLIANDSRMGHVAHGALMSREEAPLLVINDEKWRRNIRPVPGEPLTFTLNSIIYPPSEKGMRLVPFFRLHDSRYMIYWQVATPARLQEMQAELATREQEALALEAITVDHIVPGQQQPEAEHNLKFSNSESGVFRDRHWRHAAGWFSYDLDDPRNQAKVLRVTYSGIDSGRNFDILINNQLLATVSLDGSAGYHFVDVNYDIPPEIVRKNRDGKMNIMFRAHENSIAGGVFSIRILNE